MSKEQLKKIILIYFVVTLMSQVYSLDSNRLNYLKGLNSVGKIILHLIYPISKKNLPNNQGFYTLLFDCMVYENYLKPEIRGRGLGRELANDLVNKYHIYILNKRNIKTYKKILQVSNYKYINICNKYLIRAF